MHSYDMWEISVTAIIFVKIFLFISLLLYLLELLHFYLFARDIQKNCINNQLLI